MASPIERATSPSFRYDSPPADACPTSPLSAYPDLSRCLSAASSHTSVSDAISHESLGSDVPSRHSSASYPSRMSVISQASSRQSTLSLESLRSRRRGYVRPQGTDFAASARSRESVLSLGSIAHLQYYFARTGLLDGKGAQLARRKNNQQFPASPTESTTVSPRIVAFDFDSSQFLDPGSNGLVDSPLDDQEDFFPDEFDDPEVVMLPPTVSTYMHREKPVPRPPTVAELKEQLTSSLDDLTKTLVKAKTQKEPRLDAGASSQKKEPGWHEVQGVQLIDVATLAIRAAKLYYTAHEQPERLSTIKPEKELRAELFAVMEVLKQMATRGFVGGMKQDEISKVEMWIENVVDLLRLDEQVEAAEQAERGNWLWAKPGWSGTAIERELAFMKSMDANSPNLPAWSPCQSAATVPTPFLESFQSGLRLVKLHNSAVRKSQRRFGTIPVFHTDTMKPYRCADNLRYWVKAAELRWEVVLKIDPLGIVYNSGLEVWIDFEVAILEWCRKVREEIAGELRGD